MKTHINAKVANAENVLRNYAFRQTVKLIILKIKCAPNRIVKISTVTGARINVVLLNYSLNYLPKRTISVSVFQKISGEGLTSPLPRLLPPPISLELTPSGSGFALDSRSLRALDRQIGPYHYFGTCAAYART